MLGTDDNKKHGLMNYLIIAACDPRVGYIFIDGKLIFFFLSSVDVSTWDARPYT